MESGLVPASPVIVTEEIKKSRFITLLGHTEGVDAAKAFVAQARADYPDARHYCQAWVAGAPDDSQQLGFSDDGVGEVTAVVVRYFGGIKLGTGGLVKAYGGGVQQALTLLETALKVPLTEYTLLCDYAQLAGVETLLGQFNGRVVESEFQANVALRVALPYTQVTAFSAKLADFSRGALHLLSVE